MAEDQQNYHGDARNCAGDRQRDTTISPTPQRATVPDSSISVAMEMPTQSPY